MARSLTKQWFVLSRMVFLSDTKAVHQRFVSTTKVCYDSAQDYADSRKNAKLNALMTIDHHFEQEKKNKATFLELIDTFNSKNFKSGHVEFIYVAMKRMRDYGVHEDVDVYNKLIDILPKGKMVSTHWLQAETMYYPKHQYCITELLLQMEENRLIPNRETADLLIKIFGKKAMPTRRYLRMIYWLPKFKYASPWPNPEPRPTNPVDAAKLALQRMASVELENEITTYQTKDDALTSEDTWIVSSQSPVQQKLIKYHPTNLPMYVEGPFRMYLGRKDVVQYFILRADLPKNRRRKKLKNPDVVKNLKIPFFDPPTPEDMIPNFSVHEQRDGIIYGICSTGTLSKDSVLSWIRLLEKDGNPNLGKIPIVIRDDSPLGHVVKEHDLIESGMQSQAAKN